MLMYAKIIFCRNLIYFQINFFRQLFVCSDGFNNLSSLPQKLSAGQFTFWEPGSLVPPLFAPLVLTTEDSAGAIQIDHTVGTTKSAANKYFLCSTTLEDLGETESRWILGKITNKITKQAAQT